MGSGHDEAPSGRFLLDLGAEVINVEQPGLGDYVRMTPPLRGVSLVHTMVDRNKKSVGLNLKSGGGKRILERLVRLFDVFSMFERIPKPVIASIRDYVLGGGLEMALDCDFRIASETSKLGLTETNLGLIPGVDGTQRLTRLVGPSRAKRQIFLGERLSAKEALEIGLLDSIHKEEELDRAVLELATKLAKRPPSRSSSQSKRSTWPRRARPTWDSFFEARRVLPPCWRPLRTHLKESPRSSQRANPSSRPSSPRSGYLKPLSRRRFLNLSGGRPTVSA